MITNLSYPKRNRPIKFVAIGAILLVVGLLGFWLFGQFNKGSSSTEYPLYLNFAGDYVFSVPKEYSVDEQSVPGIQLVYSGTFTVKTLADLYDVGGTSVQALTELGDQNFREFVEKTFVPNLKKDIGSEDVQVRFGNQNGSDTAQITVKKDGAIFRFIHLKGGKHPAAVVAKDQNDTLKKIAQTLVDVEGSAFKDQVESLKAAIKTVGEQAREQKIDELYNAAAPELQANNTKEEVANALKASADYLKGNVTISGGSLNDPESFSVAMRFTKIDDTDQKEPAYGSLALIKVDGQWKLEMLGLPSPEQE